MARIHAYVHDGRGRHESLKKYIDAHTTSSATRRKLDAWLLLENEPLLSGGLAMLRWFQLEGQIIPVDKKTGLFAYTLSDAEFLRQIARHNARRPKR
jgi:hypothetical protein